MFQIHGKTRRGRPPKYQQYWISLAMEKAALRALANEKGPNGEATDAGSDNKPAPKDDSATKEARFQQQENNAANRKEDKSVDQPCNSQLKRRSNSWPFSENGKESIDGSTNQCNPLNVHKLLLRNNVCSATESRETGFQFVKKFKPDVPSSEHFKALNTLHSTWSDKTFGYEIPFLAAVPSRQVMQSITVQTSELKSPESQLGSSEGSNFFPRVIINSTGFPKTDSSSGGRGCFYDNLPDTGHGRFVTTGMRESALDLSRKLQPAEGKEDDAVLPEFATVEKPALPNITQENRQLLNVVQPWNVGQLPNEAQAWNADKMLLKHEHDGHSAQPTLRAFPCSRLAEVSMWSVDEVAQFVSMIPGCHEYAQCFREEDIDGLSFLQLSESHLRNVIRMKLGPSLHLKKALDDLASFGSNAAA